MIIDNLDDGLTRLRDARKIATSPLSENARVDRAIDEAPRRQEDRDSSCGSTTRAVTRIDEAPRRQEDRDSMKAHGHDVLDSIDEAPRRQEDRDDADA